MWTFRLICLLGCLAILPAQNDNSVDADSEAFRTTIESFSLSTGSQLFHRADVDSLFSFEVRAYLTRVEPATPFRWNNTIYDAIELRIARASVGLPWIDAEVGMSLTFPSSTLGGFRTELVGYFAKFQLDEWFTSYLPDIAIQADVMNLKIGRFYEQNTAAASIIVSQPIWIFRPYVGSVLTSHQVELKSTTFQQKETLQLGYNRVGLNVELLFLSAYAETTFGVDHSNLSAGISLRF